MPNVDKLNLANELRAAAAATVMPLLKAGVSETEANGFLVWITDLTAEVAITGEFEQLELAKELIPMKIATYGLRVGAAKEQAIVSGLLIVAKAARAGLLAIAGPLGTALAAAAAATATPTDPAPQG